ncbi:remorin 1.4 [Nicotiana tabacum]|uniref:Remorin n=1 Tax=Nicotiana tabacum TaxID=4097 RepID=A0A076L1Z5_TOBAC|nr:remorin-like [Nicotiana tomentosiformis]XP_016490313.1 PREDICTED: remorin-like [Nicotiana tabacum]AII99827.1 remorin 2 [Nicotiana tabacum]
MAEATPVPQEPAVDNSPAAMATKADDSKALATVPPPKTDSSTKSSKGSLDRDIALAHLETEKRNSYIKAWEESEKSKVENRAQKKLSAVGTWENTKKANLEAKLKKLEEQLEEKKAEYAEKIKNRVASVHKEADEKRAMVEARKGEELLKADEMAAKYRATGQAPKKLLGCLGC